MTKRSFLPLDVFASAPGRGNPLAVVLDATDLDSAAMQAIAAWLNLSETAFVLPPTQAGADYRLRIFTPRQELPFAGHPSVGTAHAVIERGRAMPRDGRLVQECGAGLLPIRVDGGAANAACTSARPAGRSAPPTPPSSSRACVPNAGEHCPRSSSTTVLAGGASSLPTKLRYARSPRTSMPWRTRAERLRRSGSPFSRTAGSAIPGLAGARGGPRRHRGVRSGQRRRRLDRRPDPDRRRGRAALVS